MCTYLQAGVVIKHLVGYGCLPFMFDFDRTILLIYSWVLSWVFIRRQKCILDTRVISCIEYFSGDFTLKISFGWPNQIGDAYDTFISHNRCRPVRKVMFYKLYIYIYAVPVMIYNKITFFLYGELWVSVELSVHVDTYV